MSAAVRDRPMADVQIETATMKALVQEGEGSADVLHIRNIPRPVLLDDRVLIRVRAASVNALDWHSVHGGRLLTIAGKVMRQKEQPIRGVDVAGTIEAIGKDVTQFRVGDEVFGSGIATFAQYVRAREDRITEKPASLTFEEAACMGVAGYTALQGLRDIAGVTPGQRVLVYGAGGGVGTFAVQIAKALGANVTAVTGPRNIELVRGLGPDEVLEHGHDDVARRASATTSSSTSPRRARCRTCAARSRRVGSSCSPAPTSAAGPPSSLGSSARCFAHASSVSGSSSSCRRRTSRICRS